MREARHREKRIVVVTALRKWSSVRRDEPDAFEFQ
jgi:hypothetical protein